MKRILLTTLMFLAGVLCVHAQEIVKDSNTIKAFEGQYDYDYIYADNSITCIDKQGNISYVIELNTPLKYDFMSLIESGDDITMVYHKSDKGIDSIVKNTFPKTNLTPAWKPSCVLAVKAKKTDDIMSSISPDRCKMVVGIAYLAKKKGNQMFEMAVIDNNGSIINKQTVTTNHQNKIISHLGICVNNDGVSYISYYTYITNKLYSKEPNMYNLYVINNNDISFYSTQGPTFVHQSKDIVTTNGDLIKAGCIHITCNNCGHQDLVYIIKFDYTTKELNYYYKNLDQDYRLYSSFVNMKHHDSNVGDMHYITCNSIKDIGNGSYIVLYEAIGESHKETPKTTTSTYKDNNGQMHTNTTTTIENSDYYSYTGDILVEHVIVDKSSVDFHSFAIINKFQQNSGYLSLNLDDKYHLSFIAYTDDSITNVVYCTNKKWHSKTIKIGDNNSLDISGVKDLGSHKFTNALILHDDYWIVYSKNKKRYDAQIIKTNIDKPTDNTSDTTDESPEFDD